MKRIASRIRAWTSSRESHCEQIFHREFRRDLSQLKANKRRSACRHFKLRHLAQHIKQSSIGLRLPDKFDNGTPEADHLEPFGHWHN